MTQLATRASEAPPSPPSERASAAVGIAEILTELRRVVPPMWPLADFAAVNPFAGLAGRRFLEVRRLHRDVRACDVLMSADYFREALRDGSVRPHDLESAYRQCAETYPEWYEELGATDVEAWLEGALSDPADASDASGRRYRTVAEVIDARGGTSWTSAIANELGRHCEAHYDDGQAQWPSPWKDLPLFDAWRMRARYDRRMQQLGMTALGEVLADLADRPSVALTELLSELGVPPERRARFVLTQATSMLGWASYVRQRVGSASNPDDDLVGLVAMRLAYDVALFRSRGALEDRRRLWPPSDDPAGAARPPRPALARLVAQAALETAYRRTVLTAMASPRPAQATVTEDRRLAQMVFCIDVRSEVIRRHLESLGADVETSGFAGFFGIPMAYEPLGEKRAVAQCPVLVEPSMTVRETVGADPGETRAATGRRGLIRLGRSLWKGFQTSAASCFSFVESVGLLYVGTLVAKTFRMRSAENAARFDGVGRTRRGRLGPDLGRGLDLPPDARVDLAEAMLRNLGRTDDFARLVVLCGHGTELANNPYGAAYQCGACAGHSGEPNARLGAKLLNDAGVRAGLAARGIEIPDDTWFLAAVHHTTSDEIVFHDTDVVPPALRDALAELETRTRKAGELTRSERCARIRAASASELALRGRDWAELRPEWGLAGNASFIVAPRRRTRGVDLRGRAFLHDYDQAKDPDGRVLELILTAPLIVTSWINLQYYASTVDNRAFGAGDKAIHNVAGQIGVVEGNGGDLVTGLPWQAVSDGTRLQHEPLRLSVFVEASRDLVESIIGRHESVRDLVTNDWLTLVVLDPDGGVHRWTALGSWEEVGPAPAGTPVAA